MFTYAAVKERLFKRPAWHPDDRNRVTNRQFNSVDEKEGYYRHKNAFFFPPRMDEDGDIHPIKLPHENSLQNFLNFLPEKERIWTIQEETCKENMRRKDLIMRDRLKFYLKQEWDPHAINAVGILKHRPPTFSEWAWPHLDNQNNLFVDYGIPCWLSSNMRKRVCEFERELEMEREKVRRERIQRNRIQERSERSGQERKRRKIREEETSDTEEETEDKTDEENTEDKEE